MINVRKIVSKINQKDLARSNLYITSFGDLSSFISTKEDDNGFGLNDAVAVVSSGKRLIQRFKSYGARGVLAQDGFDSLASIFGTPYDVQRDLGLMVKAITLPGTTLDTSVNYDRRFKTHIPVSSTNDTVTMTMYLSPNHEEREIMLKWLKSIHSDSGVIGFSNDYQKVIETIIMGRDGERHKSVTLDRAFPIRVGSVELGYENNNEISTFEVEFQYRKFAYVDVKNQSTEWSDSLSNSVSGMRSSSANAKGISNELFG